MTATLTQSLIEFYQAITPNASYENDYSLGAVKEFEMSYGIAWKANIKRNNKKVGTVECDGNGGAYHYSFTTQNERRNFYATVREAYRDREMIDVEEDCFINFLDYQAQVK